MSHSQRISWSCKIWGEIIPHGDYLGEWLCMHTWSQCHLFQLIRHDKTWQFSLFPFACTTETDAHNLTPLILKWAPSSEAFLPSPLQLWLLEVLYNYLCKCLDDCKGKWGTPTLMTQEKRTAFRKVFLPHTHRMGFSPGGYLRPLPPPATGIQDLN